MTPVFRIAFGDFGERSFRCEKLYKIVSTLGQANDGGTLLVALFGDKVVQECGKPSALGRLAPRYQTMLGQLFVK
jgi:hypothetical protein